MKYAISSGLLTVLSFFILQLFADDASNSISLDQGFGLVNDTTTTATCHNWTAPPKVYDCEQCPNEPCGGSDCPDDESLPDYSLIDNTNVDYRHEAVDFMAAPISIKGCSSCGNTGERWSDIEKRALMPSLTIRRLHRPMDLGEHSSFGPGVFWEFDDTFQLINNGGVWTGSLFMPLQHRALTFQQSGNSFIDGTYNSFRAITLYTSTQQIAVDPATASFAVLTSWEGITYTFELVPAISAGRIIKKGLSWVYRACYKPCAGMRFNPPQKNMIAIPNDSA